jgi:hypothetical protein
MRRAGWRGPRAKVPGKDPGGGCHGPVPGQEEGALREIRRGWAQGKGGATAIMACRPGAVGRLAEWSSRMGRGVRVKGVGLGWGRCGRGRGRAAARTGLGWMREAVNEAAGLGAESLGW